MIFKTYILFFDMFKRFDVNFSIMSLLFYVGVSLCSVD